MKKEYSELISEIISLRNIESGEDICKSQIFNYSKNLSRERYDIKTASQAKYYGKQIGRYELITIKNPIELDEKEEKRIVHVLSSILRELLGEIDNNSRILVVGLGNRHISADSLGTKVTSGINVTLDGFTPKIMAICPSVLGLTGIETYDIVSGVISRVKPTHLILIDSLCASSESRLGKSIQLSNTGICPGSGIGNNRKCLDKTLAKNVVSIGVPLLIYASTFVEDILIKAGINISRINSIMQTIKKCDNLGDFMKFCLDIQKVLKNSSGVTIVTIKDIEECVKILSQIISKSIMQAIEVSSDNKS